MSILGTLPPCSFPGCEDMSCEDYCAKDDYCGKYFGAGEAPRDKKCIECNKCKKGSKIKHTSVTPSLPSQFCIDLWILRIFKYCIKISEEPEVKPDPESCKGVKKPCQFLGCSSLSCEDFCEKDPHCGNGLHGNPNGNQLDHKCCECNLCKDVEVVTKPGGKFTHSSIPFLFIL